MRTEKDSGKGNATRMDFSADGGVVPGSAAAVSSDVDHLSALTRAFVNPTKLALYHAPTIGRLRASI